MQSLNMARAHSLMVDAAGGKQGHAYISERGLIMSASHTDGVFVVSLRYKRLPIRAFDVSDVCAWLKAVGYCLLFEEYVKDKKGNPTLWRGEWRR